jgi:hypothetical protein
MQDNSRYRNIVESIKQADEELIEARKKAEEANRALADSGRVRFKCLQCQQKGISKKLRNRRRDSSKRRIKEFLESLRWTFAEKVLVERQGGNSPFSIGCQ